MSSTAWVLSPLYQMTVLENGNREDRRAERITPVNPPDQPTPKRSFIPELLPQKVANVYGHFSDWIKGPKHPRPHLIRGFREDAQTAPLRLLDRVAPKFSTKICLLICYYILWLSIFIITLNGSALPKANTTACGVDGENCRPFENRQFVFRCPSGCQDAMVLNPYTVGNEEVNYRSLVIGGSTDPHDARSAVYRGDSFICAAAIHVGAINSHEGGLGIVSAVGQAHNFIGAKRNGIESMSFNSSFPLSIAFPLGEPKVEDILAQHHDPGWCLLAVSVIFTFVLSIFTTSASLMFTSVFVGAFFQVALTSDPPDLGGFDSIVSAALGRFLPAVFVGLGIYIFCASKTLSNLKASFEKAFLWLGGLWLGALGNSPLENLPIQRLTIHDLKQLPGGISAFACLLVSLLAALRQGSDFRAEGRLPQYLLLYLVVGLSVPLLLAIPGLELRFHYYIFALLLLPGTSMQTGFSLCLQGILVGLFISGVARSGFTSILQTPDALLENMRPASPVPEVPVPVTNPSNITFAWDALAQGFDGISVRVNDVERYRGFSDRDSLNFTWSRSGQGLDDYFRFAYLSYGKLGGPWVADYTKAGVWRSDGHWVQVAG